MGWSLPNGSEQRETLVLQYFAYESMTDLAARFGISRNTGHKCVQRFREHGVAGLSDLSRAPKRHGRTIDSVLVEAIVALKKQHRNEALGSSSASRANDTRSCLAAPTARPRTGSSVRADPDPGCAVTALDPVCPADPGDRTDPGCDAAAGRTLVCRTLDQTLVGCRVDPGCHADPGWDGADPGRDATQLRPGGADTGW